MTNGPIKGAYNVTMSVTIQVVPEMDEHLSQWEAAAMAHEYIYDCLKTEDRNVKVLFIRPYDPIQVMIP